MKTLIALVALGSSVVSLAATPARERSERSPAAAKADARQNCRMACGANFGRDPSAHAACARSCENVEEDEVVLSRR